MTKLLPLACADTSPVQLSALHARAFAEAWSAGFIDDLLRQPGTFGFIVAGRPAPAGFILARVAADESEVLTLAVAPEARRRGTGHALVAVACERAHALGARSMFLEVGIGNGPARALYERLGFRKVGERPRYYAQQGAPGEDALVLRAELPLTMGKRGELG